MKMLTNSTMEKSHQKKDVFSLPIGLMYPLRKLIVQSTSHFEGECLEKQGVLLQQMKLIMIK